MDHSLGWTARGPWTSRSHFHHQNPVLKWNLYWNSYWSLYWAISPWHTFRTLFIILIINIKTDFIVILWKIQFIVTTSHWLFLRSFSNTIVLKWSWIMICISSWHAIVEAIEWIMIWISVWIAVSWALLWFSNTRQMTVWDLLDIFPNIYFQTSQKGMKESDLISFIIAYIRIAHIMCTSGIYGPEPVHKIKLKFFAAFY